MKIEFYEYVCNYVFFTTVYMILIWKEQGMLINGPRLDQKNHYYLCLTGFRLSAVKAVLERQCASVCQSMTERLLNS